MTDQELDRALAQALEVEPSPDFLARVRAEAAREPVPSPWPWPAWWRVAAVGTAVAVLVAVVSMPHPADDAGTSPAAGSRGAVTDSRSALGPTGPTVTPEATEARVTPPAVEPMPSRRRTFSPSPIPTVAAVAADTDLLRLAIEAAQEGLLVPAGEPGEALVLPPLDDVPPIQVEPLAALTPIDAGERQ